MTPTIYNLLSGQTKMKLNRLRRIMREGSPRYHYDVGALVAAAYVEFDIATHYPRARKYQPLDTMVIINNDTVDIELRLNGQGGDVYIVTAGTIRTITREQTPAIWKVIITNLDAVTAITANMIDIDIWRAPEDADSAARGAI